MMDGVGRTSMSRPAPAGRHRVRTRGPATPAKRATFGKPIAEHQAIAFQLAEMAAKVEAAHLMMVNAARLKDSRDL